MSANLIDLSSGFIDTPPPRVRPRTQSLPDRISAAENEVSTNRAHMESVGSRLQKEQSIDLSAGFVDEPAKPALPPIEDALKTLSGGVTKQTRRMMRQAKPQPVVPVAPTDTRSALGLPAPVGEAIGANILPRAEMRDTARPEIEKQVRSEHPVTVTRPATRDSIFNSPGSRALDRQRAGEFNEEDVKAETDRRLEQQQWQAEHQPEIERQTDAIRKSIKQKGGVDKWMMEVASQGRAGLTNLAAGAVRRGGQLTGLLTGNPEATNEGANDLRISAEAAQRAATLEGADRNKVSKWAQGVTAGLISSAPAMAAMGLGVPAPLAFGGQSALESAGAGGTTGEDIRAGAHGAATGLAFELPVPGATKMVRRVPKALAKAGTVAAGTTAVELGQGKSLPEALQAGATNALMAGGGELVHGAKSQERPVEGETKTVVPDIDRILAEREVPEADRGRIRTALQQVEDGQPIHHSNLQTRTEEGQFDGPPIVNPKEVTPKPVDLSAGFVEPVEPARSLAGQQINEAISAPEVASLPTGDLSSYRIVEPDTKPVAERDLNGQPLPPKGSLTPEEALRIAIPTMKALVWNPKIRDYELAPDDPRMEYVKPASGVESTALPATASPETLPTETASTGTTVSTPERRLTEGAPPAGIDERRGTTVATPVEKELTDRLVKETGGRRVAEDLAHKDHLTGLPNKRAWEAAKDAAEKDPNTSIVMVDIRNAKAFNTEGQEAGDPHFKEAFAALQKAAEEHGVSKRQVFRVDGDEGAIVVNAGKETADAIAKRAQELYPEKQMHGSTVGLSVGVGEKFNEANTAMKAHKATQGVSLRPSGEVKLPALPPSIKGEPSHIAEARKRIQDSVNAEAESAPVEVKTRKPSSGRTSLDTTKHSLAEAVRADGGIRYDRDAANRGEISRLSPKEMGTTGLVNNRGGRNVEDAALRMAEEGYRGDWVKVSDSGYGPSYEIDPNKFIEAIESDQRGIEKSYSGDLNFDYESAYRNAHPEEMDSADALVTFLENEERGTLFDNVTEGRANESDIKEFTRQAKEFGVSNGDIADMVAKGRALSAETKGVQDTSRSTHPAEQLGFVEEGLTQQVAPKAGKEAQTRELTAAEQSRQRQSVTQNIGERGADRLDALRDSPDQSVKVKAQSLWETARRSKVDAEQIKTLETYDRLKRTGQTVEDYAKQDVLFGDKPTDAEIQALRQLEADPKFIAKARARETQRAADKAAGIKQMRSGGPDTQILIDHLLVHGWDAFQTGKTTFNEWSAELKRRFGEDIEPHLKKVWAQIAGKEDSTIVERPAPVSTGIKHEIIEAERELQGLPQFQKARRAAGVSFDEGVAAVRSHESDPNHIDPRALAREQATAARARPLSTTESMALLYDRMRIAHARKAAEAELELASKSGDEARLAKAVDKVTELQQASNYNDEADYRTGSEAGRGLAIRRELIRDDYSRARVLSRAIAINKGKPLPPEVQAKYEAVVEQLAKAHERISDLESQRESKTTEAQVETVTRQMAREVRAQGRKRTTEEIKANRATIRQNVAQAWAKQKALLKKEGTFSEGGLGKLDPEGELTKSLRDLARSYIEEGVVKAADIVDAVHEHIKDVAEGITKRQVSDLISGYGKTKESVADPVERKLNEIKSILASTSGQADVLEKGIRAARRGQQREKPTEDQRRALRDLQDAMREKGPELAQRPQGEMEQSTPLDKAKATTRNRIEQLNKWIADGKREVQGKNETIPDAELNQLKAEQGALEKVASLLEDPAADQKTIEKRLGDLSRIIAGKKADLASGNVTPEIKEGAQAVWTAEVGKLERERVELNKEISKIRTENARRARADAAAKPEAQEKARQAEIGKRLEAIDAKIASLKAGKTPAEIKEGASAVWTPEIGIAERKLEETRRTTALGSSLRTAQERIQSGNVTTGTKEAAKQTWTPEIGALSKERDALRGIMADMRSKAAKEAKSQVTQDAQPFFGAKGSWAEYEAEAKKTLDRQKSFMSRNQKQMVELQKELDRAKRGEQKAPKVKREPLPLTDEMRVAQRNANVLKRQIEQLDAVTEWANRSKLQKGLMYTSAGVRASVLSGVKVLGKIGGALANRIPQQYIEEGAGKGWAKLFPETASKAPRHGKGINVESEKAFGRGLISGAKEIPSIIKTGESELTLGHGKRYPNIPTKIGTLLAIPGRIHMAEKNILKVGEYKRSLELNLQKAERDGLSRTNPEVKALAEERAYKDAEEAILMGQSAFGRSMQNMQRTWRPESRSLFKIAIPVMRVPANYLSQAIGEYGLGIPRGLVRVKPEIEARLAKRLDTYGPEIFKNAARALRERNPELMDKLTPEEADKTMRMLKRGTLGMLYMGLTGAGVVAGGGYYSGKRKPDDIHPGDAKIGSVTIPHMFLHSPPTEMAQLVATMRREVQNATGKQGHKPTSAKVATGAAYGLKGLADQTPFLNQYTRMIDSFRSGETLMKSLGDQVASRVEPQLAKEFAAATDREENGRPTMLPWKGEAVPREVKTFSDTLKVGLPGVRQTLKKDRKKFYEARHAH